ncbi:MAG TPA: zinc-dependent metalloprotease, partial [Solirubrobacteraceae bacterium]|nr:zinc-dependent metalloprotease [Solirubrobacteraceae bacterium]
MIDRALTERIANAVSRAGAARGPQAAAPPPAPAGDLAAVCADAETRVVGYTGLRPAAPLPVPEAIPRAGWIAANVSSMGVLLDGLGERMVGGGAVRGTARTAAGVLLSVEAGACCSWRPTSPWRRASSRSIPTSCCAGSPSMRSP